MIYSVDIFIPDHYNLGKHRKYTARFKTQEEKDDYMRREYRFCKKEQIAYDAAQSMSSRASACEKLYKMRTTFYNMNFNPKKVKEEKA